MLSKDPTKRYSIEKVLLSDWVQENLTEQMSKFMPININDYINDPTQLKMSLKSPVYKTKMLEKKNSEISSYTSNSRDSRMSLNKTNSVISRNMSIYHYKSDLKSIFDSNGSISEKSFLTTTSIMSNKSRGSTRKKASESPKHINQIVMINSNIAFNSANPASLILLKSFFIIDQIINVGNINNYFNYQFNENRSNESSYNGSSYNSDELVDDDDDDNKHHVNNMIHQYKINIKTFDQLEKKFSKLKNRKKSKS